MSQTRQENSMYTMLKSMLAGSAAGAAEVIIDHPLWSIKTMMQSKKPGEKIILNPKVLYRGIMPNMFSMVPISALQFTANAGMKTMIDNQFVTAFMAGVSAATIACPIEMGMTRQNSSGASFAAACKQIVSEGGLRRIYAGFTATALRDGVFTTAIFSGKTIMKPVVSTCMSNEKMVDTASSMTAGIVAALGTQWVDMIKTTQQTEKEPVTMAKAAMKIYGNHGVAGFFKGSLPRAARVGCAVVIMNKVGSMF